MSLLFQKELVRLVMAQLQVSEDAPSYQILLRRPNEFYLAPQVFDIPEGCLSSIEVTGSREFGCRTATITVDDPYGMKSPEFGAAKHYMKAEEINDTQWNNKQRYYYNLLMPETWIQIKLGYGPICIPVLTGAIDMVEINEDKVTMTIQVRDNMRYLVDQNIDAMKHGPKLIYPRNDFIKVNSDGTINPSSSVTCVKVRGVSSYLNVRTGPGTSYPSVGKAYNAQQFQYVSSENGWHKIKFNGADRWISGAYSDVLYTNETIKTNSVVRVNKIANTTGNHLHVRTGPGTGYAEVAELGYNAVVSCIEKQGDWLHITWNGGQGWVYGAYCSVDESAGVSGSDPMKYTADYHDHLHVFENPDLTSNLVGEIYDGNTYTFLQSQEINGNYWHQISFNTPDGVKTGWLDDEAASLEQAASILSYHTIAKVINVSTHLHIRSGPGQSYAVLGEVPNGTLLAYLGTVMGDDGKIQWHHILFKSRTGEQEGYVCGTYIQIVPGNNPGTPNNPDPVPLDPNVMIDATGTYDANTKCTAAMIVHDLCVEALHVYGGNGVPFDLDRVIASVLTQEYNIEQDGQMSKYVVDRKEFSMETSYFDAAMEIINMLGDVRFWANRYGSIELFRKKRKDQTSEPDWVVRDYVEISSASLKYNVMDMRNRVIIKSANGSALFEHRGITSLITKGVDRTMLMEVPWADTLEKKRAAATKVFEQMFANWRKMDIAIVGNPLLDVDDVLRVDEMVTTSTSLYSILEYRHIFTPDGFMTQLSLEWAAKISEWDITLVSEDFPAYSKIFSYNLALNGSPRNMRIKLPQSIMKARIYIHNEDGGGILAVIDITGNTYQPPQAITIQPTVQYIVINTDGVNIREQPDQDRKWIRRIESSGFKMQYVDTINEYYEGIDPDTNTSCYVWKEYCRLETQTGTNDTHQIADRGPVQTFIDIAKSKVGCGYVWGGKGEMLTDAMLRKFESNFGYSKYHTKTYDAGTWIGKQVFDCSGLVMWILWQMGLYTSGQYYSTHSMFGNICYEVSRANVLPGDLFFRVEGTNIYHVGIVVDNNEVVEAKGTAFGVIQRALPAAEKFGRLIKLNNGSTYTVPSGTDVGVGVVPYRPIPTSYNISTTFGGVVVPQEVLDKAAALSGKLLLYTDDCILYNVAVESNGGQKNELVLSWAPVDPSVTNLNLGYEILCY